MHASYIFTVYVNVIEYYILIYVCTHVFTVWLQALFSLTRFREDNKLFICMRAAICALRS
jgi:hypothetical protein